MPTRFPAGGRIASLETLRQKEFSLATYLANRHSRTRARRRAWDPAAIESTDRIAEMLMFHGAVGGTRYTTLRNGPLSFLDLSHVLSEDRCILMGHVADPATDIVAEIDETTTQPQADD